MIGMDPLSIPLARGPIVDLSEGQLEASATNSEHRGVPGLDDMQLHSAHQWH